MARMPDPTPSRLRALLSTNLFRVGVVLLSALIIFGAYAFSQRTTGDDSGPEIASITELDDLYEEARRALEDGDTERAKALLERVLAEDPAHERANALLRRISADEQSGDDDPVEPGNGSGGSEADPGDDPAPAPPPQDPWLEPADDMGLFLPEVIEGWQRGLPVVSDDAASVPFDPAARREIRRALFSVIDRGTEADASRFTEEVSKRAYPQDAAAVQVEGVDAYFGTDGAYSATVSYSRGRFVFEVILTVEDVQPSNVRDAAISLAHEFESSR